jgi:hypothetical protein
MIYENEQQRQRQDAQLPPRLKELIADIAKPLLEEGAEE